MARSVLGHSSSYTALTEVQISSYHPKEEIKTFSINAEWELLSMIFCCLFALFKLVLLILTWCIHTKYTIILNLTFSLSNFLEKKHSFFLHLILNRAIKNMPIPYAVNVKVYKHKMYIYKNIIEIYLQIRRFVVGLESVWGCWLDLLDGQVCYSL